MKTAWVVGYKEGGKVEQGGWGGRGGGDRWMLREKPTLVREFRSMGASMGVRVVSGRLEKSSNSNLRKG